MQAKPIRNADFDRSTAKHVTFYNEKFKRGRCDLLKEIQRSTRGGNSASNLAEHQKEVDALKAQVLELEQTVKDIKREMEERVSKLELNMLGQMEQMMLAMQQNQLERGVSISSGIMPPAGSTEVWDPLPMGQNRRTSASSTLSNVPMVSSESVDQDEQKAAVAAASAPTLPPHPKQKQLPPAQGGLPTSAEGPPSRLTSLRGISFSRGLSRGLSVESTASAQVMRTSWEDKFFSMLMLGESEANAVAAANAAAEAVANTGGTSSQLMASGHMSDNMVEAALAEAAEAAGVGIESSNMEDI